MTSRASGFDRGELEVSWHWLAADLFYSNPQTERTFSMTTMDQICQQTIDEVFRMLVEQPDGFETEVATCFADLTQAQALYVAALVSARLNENGVSSICLAEAMIGNETYAIERRAWSFVRVLDTSGVDVLLRELSQVALIASIPLIAILEQHRSVGIRLADQVLRATNDQIYEVV